MIEETKQPATAMPPRGGIGKYWRIGLLVLAALGLNLLVLAIPRQWLATVGRLGPAGYLAAFAITAIANASVVVPVPYPGIIAVLNCALGNSLGVALAGAAGSTLGESTAFVVGRAGKGAVEETRFYRWLKRQLRTPLRAFVVLLVLSAPPNPFFDVAGITAGSLGVSYKVFVTATFIGRVFKMLFFIGIGQALC